MDETDNVDIKDSRPNIGGPWRESLFGCFNDWRTCCCGFWCLPCLFGLNAEKIDGSSCIGMCLAYYCLTNCSLCWVPQWLKRQALREKYHLRAEPCHDCPTVFCCGPCAVCQEARELEARGANRVGPNVLPVRAQQPVAYRR